MSAVLCLVVLGVRLADAFRVQTRSARISGVAVHHPIRARTEGRPFLASDAPIDEILSSRGWSVPDPDAAATGCPFTPGLVVVGQRQLVLLGNTHLGRLAAAPGVGLELVSIDEAIHLSGAGRCVPAPRADPR
jgi:hypothetical protein